MSRSTSSIGTLRLRLATLSSVFVLAIGSFGAAQSVAKPVAHASGPRIAQSAALPLMFEKNVGPPAASGDFTARGDGYTLHLKAGEMSLRVVGQSGKSEDLNVSFAGANRKALGAPLDKLPTLTNYFIGRDRTKWRTGVSNYSKVRYAGIYPGVDVLFYGNDGRVEHDFVLAPHADPRSVVLEVSGAKSVALNASHDVVLSTANGAEFLLKQPALYQQSGATRFPVRGEYRLLAHNRIGFKIDNYDRNRELTIDPVLVFATYLGAAANGSNGNAIANGSGGDAYVVGTVYTDFSNLTGSSHVTPVTPPNSTVISNGTVFVAKFAAAANGSTLAWLSYIGGTTGPDLGNAISFGGTQVVIAGTTSSADFPISTNKFSSAFTVGSSAAFVAALDSVNGGATKYYNTYVTVGAPNGPSFGNAVGVGGTGNILVAGATRDGNLTSTDCSTLVGGGATNNSFVAELTSPVNGTTGTLVNATVFSGGGDNQANGLAVNGTDIFVVGQAATSFPTDTPMPGSANLANVTITSPGTAAYFAHVVFVPAPGVCPTFSPSLANSRVYHDNGAAGSTDTLNGIAFQSGTSIYVAGQSNSATLSSLNAAAVATLPATTNSGGEDALVLNINPTNLTVGDASEVLAAKEIGGSNADAATSVSVDTNGQVFVGGTTASLNGAGIVFPSTILAAGSPLDTAIAGVSGKAQAGFVAELSSNLATTTFANVIGADTTDSDAINGVAAATGSNATLKGDVVAITGTFHGLSSTSPNITASAFLTNVSGGPIANGSAYVGLLEYNGSAAGVNNFAAGAFPATVTYGDAVQYTFNISVATTQDSILNIPAVVGLKNLTIDAGSDTSFNAATNCTTATGGITCIIPTNASGNIIVDGTVIANTGSFTVIATLSDANNNSTTVNTETSTASPATLTITADPQTKVYGQADPTLTFMASGFVNGDTAGSVLAGSLTRAAGEAVGTYAITQGTVAANSNYTINFTGANFTITPATLTITANALSKVYGQSDPALTFASSGFQFSDNAGTVLTGALTRAAGEAVGTYAITQGTLAANSNYTINFTGANFTITPATLTVTANALSKVYGQSDPALTFASSGFQFTDNVGTVLTGALARAAGEAVSTYAITQGTLAANTNYTISFTGANFTITPATLTITANARTKVYGQPDPALTVVSSGFQFTDNATTVLTGSLTRAPGEAVAGSPYAISQGTLAANTNYTISFTGANFTITPATLTITANGQTKVYGQADPALTFASSGFQFADNAGSVLTGSLTRAAGETVSGNPYAITQGTLASNTNYTIGFTGANLTITPALLTITADAKTKVYGDADPALTFVASGFKFTDNVGSVLTGSLTRAAGETVAGSPYAISQGTLASNTNYTVNFTGNNLTITKRSLHLTPNAQSANKIYDRTTSATVTFSDDRVGTDTLTFASTASFTDSNAGTGKLVNITGIAINPVGAAGNYTLASGTTAATTSDISAKAITVNVTVNDKPYDANVSATVAGCTPNQIISGDTVTCSAATANFLDKSVGNGKSVVAGGLSLGGNTPDKNNYSISGATAITANITPAHLTVTANNKSRGYAAADPAFDAVVSNFVGGENLATSGVTGAASCTTTALASSAIGNYPITCTQGALSALNYDFPPANFIPGTLTITSQTLTVTPNNNSRQYGAANPSFDGTVTGVVNGDNITATFSSVASTNSVVGSYPITAALNDPGNKLGNYAVTLNQGTLTVTQTPLTVSANNKSRLYGDPNPALDGTLTGVVPGDNITANFSTTAAATTGIGNVGITASLNDPGNRLGNYSVSNNPGTLTIAKAHLIVNAVNQTRVYGAANPTTSFGLSGFKNGENQISANVTGSPTLSDATLPTNAVGTYSITVVDAGNLSAPNYDFLMSNFVNGVLTITPAPLSVAANNASKTYGQTTTFAGTEFTATGLQNNDAVTSVTLTSAGSPGTALVSGSPYTITASAAQGTGLSNYTITFPTGKLTVNPAPLSITANSINKTYGQTVTFVGNEFTTSGLLNGDTVTSATVTSAGAAANAPVGGSPYTITPSAPVGSGLGNYTPNFITGTLMIAPAHLTVTANPQSHIFGSPLPGLTATLTGFVNGEALGTSGVTGTASCTSPVTVLSPVASYTIACTQGTLSAQNYDFPAANFASGNFVVTQATSQSVVTAPVNSGNAAELMFQANVSPQFTGTPTGSVTFLDNGSPLSAGSSGSSTVTLTNGAAIFTLNLGQLATGQHKITAAYNGDVNFKAATVVAANVAVMAAVTTSPGAPIPAQTVQLNNNSGQDVTYNSLKCNVLSALGQPVANTLCSVNQGSITVPNNGSASITVQLATNTASAQPAPSQASLRGLNSLWLAMPAVFFLPFAAPASARRKLLSRKAITWLGITLLLVFLLMSMGCGGGGFNNTNNLQPGSGTNTSTQPGNYIVQVTGTGPAGQTALASIPLSVGF